MNSHDHRTTVAELRLRFPQYLRRPQASQYLAEIWGLSYTAATLAKLCCQGTGPATHRDGKRALHTPESLDDFARSRIKPSPRKRSEPHHEAHAA
jgi:hypothetical protein